MEQALAHSEQGHLPRQLFLPGPPERDLRRQLLHEPAPVSRHSRIELLFSCGAAFSLSSGAWPRMVSPKLLREPIVSREFAAVTLPGPGSSPSRLAARIDRSASYRPSSARLSKKC